METLFRVESVLQASEGTAFLNHGATDSVIYYAFIRKPVPDFLNGHRHRRFHGLLYHDLDLGADAGAYRHSFAFAWLDR